jgi:hypothetical protein
VASGAVRGHYRIKNAPDMVGAIHFSAVGISALIVEDTPTEAEPMTHELVAAIASERVGSVCRLSPDSPNN